MPSRSFLSCLFSLPLLAACASSSSDSTEATGLATPGDLTAGSGGQQSGGSSQGGTGAKAGAGGSVAHGGSAGASAGAAGQGPSGAAGKGLSGGAAGKGPSGGAAGKGQNGGAAGTGGSVAGTGGSKGGAAGVSPSGGSAGKGGAAAGSGGFAAGGAGQQGGGEGGNDPSAGGGQSGGGTESGGEAGQQPGGAAGDGDSGSGGNQSSGFGGEAPGGSAGQQSGGSAGQQSGGSAGSGGAFCGTLTLCDADCVDLDHDPEHCGSCDHPCAASMVCQGGLCTPPPCAAGLIRCGDACVDLVSDDQHCGGCATACGAGLFCSGGQCGAACVGGTTRCDAACVDLGSEQQNCGSCGHSCEPSERCADGACAAGCAAGTTLCQGFCADTKTSGLHCGGCGHLCGPGESCVGGVCGPFCNSATTDCDGDGWTVAEGDCCDKPGDCSVDPAKVNPGAAEIAGNGADDNCNGLADLADTDALLACDGGLGSVPADPTEIARALGICQLAMESPPKAKRTWGLLDAAVLRADGSPLGDPRAVSIRPSFGQISPATVEGTRLLVLSTGIAADETQVNPGPNGGLADGKSSVSTVHLPASVVSLADPGQPRSIHDWFAAENLPLKPANALPTAPGCVGSQIDNANDSVMLVLRLRAPTNARAFSLRAYFLSAEYPNTVCTTYNDQLVALVRTPTATPSAPNPSDGNLMTYLHGGQAWPIGINIASGTPLFSVCDRQSEKPECWKNSKVSPDSCSLGPGQLAGTGFEFPLGCATGGGSYWLTTRGNVAPGEEVEIRVALWDVGDSSFDSLVLLDGFRWLPDPVTPGTTP